MADIYDPRFQGLLTLAAGLLAQSGPQPRRVPLGAALGQSAIPALQAMMQARRGQVEMADVEQMRRLRELEMRKLGFQIGQEEALPGQLGKLADVTANPEKYMLPDTGRPVGTQVQPMQFAPQAQPPMPFAPPPVAAPQQMQQNLLGPFATGGQFPTPGMFQQPPPMVPRETPGMQMTGETTARMPDEMVLGRQAQSFNDAADVIEQRFSTPPDPNRPELPWHPKAIEQGRAQAKIFRDKAERLDKIVESRRKKPEFEEFAVGGTPDEPIFQKFRVMPDGTLIAQKGTYKKKALVELKQPPAATKYSEKFGGGIADQDINKMDEAMSARAGIGKIDDLLGHLQSSKAITGLGADLLNNVERARTLLLSDVKAGKAVSDTELLDAMLGSDVFPMIKSLGIGARGLDTPAEREFLRKVMSGTINMNKQTLIKMAQIRRNIAVRSVEQWNDRLESIPEDALKGTGMTRTPIKIPQSTFKETTGPKEPWER